MIHLTDPKQMLEQWTKFQEISFKNTLNSMEIFQKRAEKMATQFWDQTVWTSEKISDVMMDWGNIYKTGYENLQETLVPLCAMVPKDTPNAE